MTRTHDAPGHERVRIQTFLSDAGVASRRRAEQLVLEGRVLVNDEPIGALPFFVDPRADRVICDGSPVRLAPPVYYLVHKPRGFVCTHRDPSGRPRAVDLLPPGAPRVFPVGRLEVECDGLLLMTNDGQLAQRIAHPRYGVPKVYRAVVVGRVAADLPERLRRGVYLAEGRARATHVRVIHAARERSTLEITVREARNREVRRMLARLGHKLMRLTRVAIGPLELRGLPPGAARPLSEVELRRLRRALDDAPAQSVPPGAARPHRRGPRDGARPPSGPPLGRRARRNGARRASARGSGGGGPAAHRRGERPRARRYNRG